jgi:hypothetical protein
MGQASSRFRLAQFSQVRAMGVQVGFRSRSGNNIANRPGLDGCLRLVQLQSRPTAVAGCSNETIAEVYDYRDERTGGPLRSRNTRPTHRTQLLRHASTRPAVSVSTSS